MHFTPFLSSRLQEVESDNIFIGVIGVNLQDGIHRTRFVTLSMSTNILLGDPVCDLCHYLFLYTIEAMVCHRFTGIALVLSSFNRD